MFRSLLGVAAFIVGSTACAADAVTVKIRKIAAGDMVQVTSVESMETVSKLTANGKTEEKTEKTGLKVKFTEEVLTLDKDGKKPATARRSYEKAEATKGDAAATAISLVGKPIDIALDKDGKYTFTQDGKPVGPDALDILVKDFAKKGNNRDEVVFPKTPVKPGDSWPIEIEKAAADLAGEGATIDFKKSTATGKLVKTYEQGGKTFGVIEVTMDLVVTELKSGQTIPLKAGSNIKIEVVLDGCIDGTESTGKSNVKFNGKFDVDLPGLEMTLKLTGTNTGEKKQIVK